MVMYHAHKTGILNDLGFASMVLIIILCHVPTDSGNERRRYPAGTHFARKTSSRQRLQDVRNVNSEDVHKT